MTRTAWFGGAAAPSGAAGGVLGGTYPDPTFAVDMATQAELDAAILGFDWKNSVRAASTSNIALTGAQTIDGVSVIAGDRVLVAGQTLGQNNGIYVAAAGAWARAADADVSAEVTFGMAVPVAEGTANGDAIWLLTTNDPITLGTTPLVFAKLPMTTGLATTGHANNSIPASIAGTLADLSFGAATVLARLESGDIVAATVAQLVNLIRPTFNAQVGTSYTFVIGDANNWTTFNNGAAISVLIPTNASVAFPVGTCLYGAQIGAGQVTIEAVTPGTTTIISTGAVEAEPVARAENSAFTAIKTATDTWLVVGDIE